MSTVRVRVVLLAEPLSDDPEECYEPRVLGSGIVRVPTASDPLGFDEVELLRLTGKSIVESADEVGAELAKRKVPAPCKTCKHGAAWHGYPDEELGVCDWDDCPCPGFTS